MSFFSKLGERLSGAVTAVVNLDKLVDEEEARGERAPPPGTTGRAPMGPEYRHLNLHYITDHLIAMGFPSSSDPPTRIQSTNDAAVVAKFLNERHNGHYMIWNLSEETYDAARFNDQVIEYRFPGHPAPPLGLLFKICTSVENWILADEHNVAVIHCMTGKGRTATVLAAVLAWLGKQDTPMQALNFVSEQCGLPLERMTIPSQRRYTQYFTNMMDGVKPRSAPLVLRRVILNGVPDFSRPKGVPPDDVDEEAAAAGVAPTPGCRPYLQLFKSGALLYSSTWAPDATDDGGQVEDASRARMYRPSDGSIRFSVNVVTHGDILIRCRHLGARGMRETMFRAAFHSGYVRQHVLRFSVAQLDVACTDPRFPSDAFLELIFSPVEVSDGAPDVATSAPAAGAGAGEGSGAGAGAAAATAAAHTGEVEGLVTITAKDRDSYDAALAAESQFWEEVATRKRDRQLRREAAAAAQHAAGAATSPSATSPPAPSFGLDGSDEEEDDDGEGGNAVGDVSTAAVGATAAACGFGDDTDGETELGITLSSPKQVTPRSVVGDEGGSSGATAGVAGAAGGSSADDKAQQLLEELDELEALEKELGLGSTVVASLRGDDGTLSPSAAPAPAAPSAATSAAPPPAAGASSPLSPPSPEAASQPDADATAPAPVPVPSSSAAAADASCDGAAAAAATGNAGDDDADGGNAGDDHDGGDGAVDDAVAAAPATADMDDIEALEDFLDNL